VIIVTHDGYDPARHDFITHGTCITIWLMPHGQCAARPL
jgi:hypothetical protein